MTKFPLAYGVFLALVTCAAGADTATAPAAPIAAPAHVTAAAAAATPTPAAATAAPAAGTQAVASAATQPTPKAAKPKLVCEESDQLGSHFRARICMTPEQVEERRRATQQMLLNRNRNCGTQSACSGGPPPR